MERKIYSLIIIMLFISPLWINASYRSEIYSAYINNKIDQWKSVIDRMDAIPDKSDELLFELVDYQYGYIGYCIGFDKENEDYNYS